MGNPLIKVYLVNDDEGGQGEVVEFYASDVLAHNNDGRTWEQVASNVGDPFAQSNMCEEYALSHFKRRDGDQGYRADVLEGLTVVSNRAGDQVVKARRGGGAPVYTIDPYVVMDYSLGRPFFALRGDNHSIVDPCVSPCGRFKVDPQDAYGFTPDQASQLKDLNNRLGTAIEKVALAITRSYRDAFGIGPGDQSSDYFSSEENVRSLYQSVVAMICQDFSLCPDRDVISYSESVPLQRLDIKSGQKVSFESGLIEESISRPTTSP